MLYICIFSNKFDLTQAIHVSHSTVKKLKSTTFWRFNDYYLNIGFTYTNPR